MVPPTPGADAACAPPDIELPTVGVVVLNWNSAWFTRRCLTSVAALDYPQDRLRVVLVDNGSIDGSLEQITHWLARPGAPSVEVLATGANLGFAEGCNRAMRALLSGDSAVHHIALLNNDAWAEPSWLTEMVAVMEGDERCAAVSSRLLLEPRFSAVEVEAGDSDLTLESVRLHPGEVDEAEVIGRVRTEGFSDEGALEWPPRRIWHLGARSVGRIWIPGAMAEGTCATRFRDGNGSVLAWEGRVEGPTTALLNGLGTALNESGEGFDIGYGRPDPFQGETAPGPAQGAELGSDRPDGFCGGAALLRSDALHEVGLFDPRFFAYYEDTDLSWRMRNAGWSVRTAPAAVAHHAFGASGGGGSRWHVFLDRRNWLVTNFRNGEPADRRRALGWFWRGSRRLFRVNVFGRLRRGRPARFEPLLTWKLAALAAVLRRPGLRARRRPGWQPTDRVRGVFQSRSSPKAPEPWPGGPLVVYVDVGETIKAGYRAGIQRVVCAIVTELPSADARVEVVPIRWCERNRAFRRLTSAEYASLLRAGDAPEAPEETPVVSAAKSALRSALGRFGVLVIARRVRERLFGAGRRATEDALVIDRLAAGAVLLELDAVWNERGLDRGELLSSLRAAGVHVATFVHDLLPVDHPEWFAPALRRIFVPTVLAQLRSSELLLCASGSSESQIAAVCSQEGMEQPPVRVVELAGRAESDRAPRTDTAETALLPAVLEGVDYLLVVGTLEPRKNHELALDVFEALSSEFPRLHLVFAGRHGWGVDELAERLAAHRAAGHPVHWLEGVHDDLLEELYRDAFAVLVPSLSEGFGLPLVEALSRGVPVVASDVSALRQAGGEAALYIDPADPDPWVRALRSMLSDPAVHDRALASARSFVPTRWTRTASQVAGALVAAFGGEPVHVE